MNVTFQTSNAACASANNGKAKALVNGGLAPYVIQWSNGQSGDSLQAAPGTYSVTITDAEGYIQSSTVTIGANSAPVVTLSASATTVCAGEEVNVTASGMESYYWLNDSSSSNQYLLIANQTTTLTVVGSLAAGCPDTASIQIVANPAPIWYLDADEDGFGDPSQFVTNCDQPLGYVSNSNDCNDANNSINSSTVFYQDLDGDGFGGSVAGTNCPSGQVVLIGGDCNDNNANINPNATEVCNGVDDDCDGLTDEGVTTTFYLDSDNDGYGNPAQSTQACSQPVGYVTNNLDCNDANASIHPLAQELCGNGIDDNCNGQIDEECTVTNLAVSSCGITVSNLSTALVAVPITGAQDYRFRVSNGEGYLSIFTVGGPTNSFSFNQLSPAVTLSTSYTVEVGVKLNGIWGDWGNACQVSTPVGPTTALVSTFCSATINSPNSGIVFSTISGATSYNIWITNAGLGYSQVYNTGTATNSFRLNAFTGLRNGTSYTVRVSAVTPNGNTAYGSSCTIQVDYKTTLSSTNCGISLSSLNTLLTCNGIVGASYYSFRVTGPFGYDQTFVTPTNSNSFRMSSVHALAPLLANTTYQVSVAVIMNGSIGTYGTPCSITTPPVPPTTLRSNQCGRLMTSPNSGVLIQPATGANSYLVQLSNSGLGYSQVLATTATTFYLRDFTGLRNGETYAVRVAVVSDAGTSDFGTACNLVVNYQTQLSAAYCGTTVSALNSKLTSNGVVGTTRYHYHVFGPGAYNQTWISPNNSNTFRLSFVHAMAPLSPGTTYQVSVAVEMNGGLGAFGDTCLVTTPGILREEQLPLSDPNQANLISIYPNPSKAGFTIARNGIEGQVEFRVWDVTGKVYYQANLSNEPIELGQELVPGFYFVTITHESGNQVFKLIKE
ncbi:MAG: T9SS type A sorting domain-containing protein, partial [Bacteroidia bacterium]|nr:T9SS type A sorting domain-containing protein [Bacteroidia bacterium]